MLLDAAGNDILATSPTYTVGDEFERTPAFNRWFGNSQAVRDGQPIILYHGTWKAFRTFDPDKFQQTDAGFFGAGIYLSATSQLAACYGKYVMPLLASIQKLFVWPFPYRMPELFDGIQMPEDHHEKARLCTKVMREAGYDGCVGRNPVSGTSDWVVFSPKHVKSIWNDGAWSDSMDVFR